MKKLNRKGFTLIELLAVIVIMAIILIVTVPNIINSISDARTNSLHNLAVSTVNTYNTAFSQDLLTTDVSKKVLGNIPEKIDTTWKCIGSLASDAEGNTTKLEDALGLSDVTLTGTAYTGTETAIKAATTCSSIRKTSAGEIEVLLVADSSGRFSVAGQTTYAFSNASESGSNANAS